MIDAAPADARPTPRPTCTPRGHDCPTEIFNPRPFTRRIHDRRSAIAAVRSSRPAVRIVTRASGLGPCLDPARRGRSGQRHREREGMAPSPSTHGRPTRLSSVYTNAQRTRAAEYHASGVVRRETSARISSRSKIRGNHKGGQIEFGRRLPYISIGDGAAATIDEQREDRRHARQMLRINATRRAQAVRNPPSNRTRRARTRRRYAPEMVVRLRTRSGSGSTHDRLYIFVTRAGRARGVQLPARGVDRR